MEGEGGRRPEGEGFGCRAAGRKGEDSGAENRKEPDTGQNFKMSHKKSYTDPSLWPRLKERAKEFRSKPTEAESILWERIKGKKLKGSKFRRQHPIKRFIVDFCCSTANLVVELDGEIHRGKEAEDAAREEVIEALGYKVIRFSNSQVTDDIESVLEEIQRNL